MHVNTRVLPKARAAPEKLWVTMTLLARAFASRGVDGPVYARQLDMTCPW